MNIKQLHEKFETYFKDWDKESEEMKELFGARDEDDVMFALYNVASIIGERKGWGEEGIGELQQQFIDELGIEDLELSLD